MSPLLIIIIGCLYMGGLFGIAFWAERRAQRGARAGNQALVYALSLGVYCTAWTYYGSVGRAAGQGMAFLPIYLGPVITAPLWMVFLRKMILISKHQRLTSIADFISSRYGKSTSLGMLATLMAVLGIIPYISIQLKAIAISFELLTGAADPNPASFPFYQDPGLFLAIALALFTMLYGARKLDPNERHDGMVATVAFESVFKLAAFLAVGIFVTFGLFDGFGDLFSRAWEQPELAALFAFEQTGMNAGSWFWLTFLSMSAFFLLPRQFHIAVVENADPGHLRKASWIFPLYLFLIILFVMPVALGGRLLFGATPFEADAYVLHFPLEFDRPVLAVLVALGGFSAATSMVIVAVIALSIMISNHLVLPFLLGPGGQIANRARDLSGPILGMRRISIVLVLLLAYAYFRFIGSAYPLVSIGLISFAAIAQFVPAVIGGMYWKRANRKGALAGMLLGFACWFYTLPLPTLVETTGLFSRDFLLEGPWGVGWLRPYSLFGLQEANPVAHSAYWSLLFNTAAFVGFSLFTRQEKREITQATLFTEIERYQENPGGPEVLRRQARIGDIQLLLGRFLGPPRMQEIMSRYEAEKHIRLQADMAGRPDLVDLAETHLAGAIGAASAKLIISRIAKEEAIPLEEMLKILEQTQEAIAYSKALEKKSRELESTTRQLRSANARLQELDRLKADFIATITHELRTPMTSIRSLAQILRDHEHLTLPERGEYLRIILHEADRISRLINQVLDLERSEDLSEDLFQPVDLAAIVRQAVYHLEHLAAEKGIDLRMELPDAPVVILGHPDRLTQVVINLLSNAIKFCPDQGGRIGVSLSGDAGAARLSVADNGIGMAPEKQELIFDKFTQVHDRAGGKPHGSGLGLYITRNIVHKHHGQIRVESRPGRGATFTVSFPRMLLPVDVLVHRT